MRFARVVARVLVTAAVAGALSCTHESSPTNPRGGGTPALRVLFMGNSLTYTNDLPGMVSALAAASGLDITADDISQPDYALIDHFTSAERQKVRDGKYDYVILQQGPSSLDVNRDSLRLWTAMWMPDIQEGRAKPALFSVWPESSRMYAYPDVALSYRLAAQDVGGAYFPVGDTWLEVWKSVPDAQLYGGDGYHPAVAGSYAAAVVIVATLAVRDATTLSADFPPAGFTSQYGSIDPTLAATIRGAAQAVIAREGIRPQ